MENNIRTILILISGQSSDLNCDKTTIHEQMITLAFFRIAEFNLETNIHLNLFRISVAFILKGLSFSRP